VNEPTRVRIDQWLWAVRLYKTRTEAADACRGGKVKIGGKSQKPAHEVRVGETLTAHTGELTRTVKVVGLVAKRVGAPLVPQFMEDLTPPEELAKPRQKALVPIARRPKGAGRPTKKDRRQMEAWQDSD
jgi:ribosome-associated heat shock protein Hsp15